MMFEDDRTGLDRAYVQSQVPTDEGVRLATQWCLSRVDGNYRQISLRVPSKRVIMNSAALQRLQRAGVAVSGESRRGTHQVVSGPLIVHYPTLESLCEAEDSRLPTSLVVVGAYGLSRSDDIAADVAPVSAGLRPWVSAFGPERLAGDLIEPQDPILADPVLMEAMKTFTASTNSSTGLTDSRDRSRVIDGLNKLRSRGHPFEPDDLLAAALVLNWRGTAAWDLRTLAKEINAGVSKRFKETYRNDIVQVWEDAAAKLRQ